MKPKTIKLELTYREALVLECIVCEGYDTFVNGRFVKYSFLMGKKKEWAHKILSKVMEVANAACALPTKDKREILPEPKMTKGVSPLTGFRNLCHSIRKKGK